MLSSYIFSYIYHVAVFRYLQVHLLAKHHLKQNLCNFKLENEFYD